MEKAVVAITKPNLQTAMFTISGTAPYVQNRFSEKAKEEMHGKQAAGSTASKGKKREPKDFNAAYHGAFHISRSGWYGIPAVAFRKAMISACKTVGFMMTRAKLAIFIEADGFDVRDSTPLVRITNGEPEYLESYVRLDTGVPDLRARPVWHEGWQANVRVRYDADMFTMEDIANLMQRAGEQVGVGEGRPDSPHSAGMGWGMWSITK